MFHRHPDSNTKQGYCTLRENLTFSSSAIFKLLCDFHIEILRETAINYFNLGSGAKGGTNAGLLFEQICLFSNPIAGIHTIQNLCAQSPTTTQIEIPTRQNYFNNFEELTLETNLLYIPERKNFESVAAFY